MRTRVVALGLGLSIGTAVLFFGSRMHLSGGKSAAPKPRNEVQTPDQHEAKMLAAALKQKPDHTPLLFRLAQIAEQSGKPAEAVPYLRKIVAKEPNNNDAHLELGKALFELGDIQGAIEENKGILERSPSHADALFNLGAIYANLGNGPTARQYWTRLISSDPASDSARRAKTMLTQLPKES